MSTDKEEQIREAVTEGLKDITRRAFKKEWKRKFNEDIEIAIIRKTQEGDILTIYGV
jgi:hypothetical protein